MTVADILIKGLPDYAIKMFMRSYNIDYHRTTPRAILKKRILEDSSIACVAIEIYEKVNLLKEVVTDFNPLNTQDMEDQQRGLERIRRQRLQQLEQGIFKLIPVDTTPNPVIEASKEIENELRALNLVKCGTCQEARPGAGGGDSLAPCQRCTREKPSGDKPYKYSAENDMFPGKAPPELSDLSLIEQSAICQIRSIMKIIRLRIV